MDKILDPEEFEPSKKTMPKQYREFRDAEGIPVHKGLHVTNLLDLETDHWERTGQRGALVNLYGMEGFSDLQILDIESEGETDPQRHLHQHIVFVMDGNGFTRIQLDDGDEVTFEWQKNSLFVVPRNAEYTHINGSDDRTRLICETDLPQILQLFEDERFVFDCEYNFLDADEVNYSDGDIGSMFEELPLYGGSGTLAWQANFVPDVTQFDEIDKDEWENLGASKVIRVPFPLSNSERYVHIAEMPVGTYKNAHRHQPGANVFVSAGEGYTLLWKDGGEKYKIDWEPNSVFTPPAHWYHAHFNTGNEPAKHWATHTHAFGTMTANGILDSHIADNIIPYDREDDVIEELYRRELDEKGVEYSLDKSEDYYANLDFD